MKVLIVGSGGREHALALKIKESSLVKELIFAPGNGGMQGIGKCFNVAAADIDGMLNLAKSEKVDLAVIAPDDPLVMGMADAFFNAGIMAYGPSKAAAAIEGSKVVSKELMQKYDIPSADYKVFENAEDALNYIKTQNSFPAVVKAEGLALGKGVIIAANLAEAEKAIDDIMVKKIFGASGNRVVIEEFLTGPEVSVLAFTDGETVIPMPGVQDHKRIFDNDKGPNTGGMGTFSPSRHYTKEIADICCKDIFEKTMDALNKENRKFKGTIFFGLMLTEKGPKVIEYNCRFGDPETQVLMPRLKTDIVEIMLAVINGKLKDVNIEWEDKAAVCVVLASGGYPGSYEKGKLISGISKAESLEGVTVYHAGTKLENGAFYTNGGRVVGVTAKSEGFEDARKKAYEAAELISFEGMQYRKDIGNK